MESGRGFQTSFRTRPLPGIGSASHRQLYETRYPKVKDKTKLSVTVFVF